MLLDVAEPPFNLKITAVNGQLDFDNDEPVVKENSPAGRVQLLMANLGIKAIL